MPINKPTTPPKKTSKPQGKAIPAKGGARPKSGGHHAEPPPPPPPALGLWDQLSPERRLDVIGIILAAVGALIFLGLVSAKRSILIGGTISFLAQIFGWGIYILPFGLLGFGLWLVFRKIERIPPLSLERSVGSVILYLAVLTLLHNFVASVDNAEAVALNGVGGGYIGSLFQRILWGGLGTAGGWIALVAWFILGISMTLDRPVQDMFRWLGPILARIRDQLFKRISTPPEPGSVAENGYTPLTPAVQPPATETSVAAPAVVPAVTTTVSHAIQWALPQPRDILDAGNAPAINEDFIQQRARLIEATLASFGAPAQVVSINRGPTITQFGVEPLFVESRGGARTRVRVSKIASLSDDLALALAAPRIRIQAPVPGHSYVGIEVPNDEMALVSLRDVVESETFQRNRKALSFALGQDVAGHPIMANLENMPHLLIAGTTGSGKSVCVNAIITCFLMYNTPDDLRIVLVDPKRVELTGYNGIPHLLGPVVVEMDRVIGALQWMTREMDKRYHEFAKVGARNIADYNTKMKLQNAKRLPNLVIIIDELADLMMIAPDETEKTITRLAQLARATGIHMILATQRPSVDVVTGLIKANFPARIAFAVASNTDSRVILDQPGAERLLGRGDMLYQSPDAPSAARLQGVFVSDHEIQKLVEFWHNQAAGASPYAVAGDMPADSIPTGVPLKQQPLWDEVEKSDEDPLLDEAIDIVRREGRASVSMLQRRLRIGYTRSARLVDKLEEKGIVGPPEGATQVRQVLDYGQTAPPKDDGA
ncbi:MAG: DNA translocase FtsK 4TM domain-containing protein [Chloroflexi bacterium]|nr:DNA translocase FtsK 4TM domain-containing protein [Chloroflexota bacterium]